ncbi:MAG: hypothetical protein IPJ88_18895 [Myxococcales bacterium]|nr:MAG: hypothetical protein IPJ88_18895 [Myxococcales bacterium]
MLYVQTARRPKQPGPENVLRFFRAPWLSCSCALLCAFSLLSTNACTPDVQEGPSLDAQTVHDEQLVSAQVAPGDAKPFYQPSTKAPSWSEPGLILSGFITAGAKLRVSTVHRISDTRACGYFPNTTQTPCTAKGWVGVLLFSEDELAARSNVFLRLEDVTLSVDLDQVEAALMYQNSVQRPPVVHFDYLKKQSVRRFRFGPTAALFDMGEDKRLSDWTFGMSPDSSATSSWITPQISGELLLVDNERIKISASSVKHQVTVPFHSAWIPVPQAKQTQNNLKACLASLPLFWAWTR